MHFPYTLGKETIYLVPTPYPPTLKPPHIHTIYIIIYIYTRTHTLAHILKHNTHTPLHMYLNIIHPPENTKKSEQALRVTF